MSKRKTIQQEMPLRERLDALRKAAAEADHATGARLPSLRTYEGAPAFSYEVDHPLIALVFTMGSAMFTDGFYQTQGEEIVRFASLLLGAHKAEPRFPWQYAAWIRDPKGGKGNRIQGTLAIALLDSLLDPSDFTRPYVRDILSHRPDDAIAFFAHFQALGLGKPSSEAQKGMAEALCRFDEYSFMKYARQQEDLRLVDILSFLRPHLAELKKRAELVLAVGAYLRASSRKRREASILRPLPLTACRKELFALPKEAVGKRDFSRLLEESRVTWEQALSHFGYDHALGVGKEARRSGEEGESARRRSRGAMPEEIRSHNRRLWSSLLSIPGLLPDLAFLRNLRNMHESGFSEGALIERIKERKFSALWPHQVYSAFQKEPSLEPLWTAAFRKMSEKLPSGRHLGIGDASGSMSAKVGGAKGSLKAVDLAFCFVGLMSETSGLGASFSDNSWFSYSEAKYLSIGERKAEESALAFSARPDIRAGMGGTQVFGAVIELIAWLADKPSIQPPDVLWFFSDMQFHPAAGTLEILPPALVAKIQRLGVSFSDKPPMAAALDLYRRLIGPVDVVLWNLAAYSPIPVPSDIPGVLLLSGFDTKNFDFVERWRKDPKCSFLTAAESQEIILETIRSY